MRIIILSIALLFCAFSAHSQVLKSAGVWYFLDVDSMTARPAVLPNGTELAYVIGTKKIYYWDRGTSTWTEYSTGSGSTFNRDSIYFDSSIVGSGTVGDPWRVDSTLFATIAGVGDSIANALLGYLPIEGGTLTGTGGAGFIGFPSQVSAPGTPASGLNVYAQGSSFNWKGTDGYERQFASTLTGGRTYTLPDVSGTFALGTGTTNRVPLWTATNTLGNSNIQDNNTVVSILNSKPFQLGQWTTAGRPTGTSGYMGWNTTLTGVDWYNGTRWAVGLESTFARGTATRIPFFDANGQVTDDAGMAYNNSTDVLTISSNGTTEGVITIDGLASATGNPGRITYSSGAGYTQGLEIISNKFIKLIPSSVDNYVTQGVGGIPNSYTGNFIGFSNSALGGYNFVIGGNSSSTRFNASLFSQINATDGNFSSTIYAPTLLLRGGNALLAGPGSLGHGGDVIIRGGNRLNTNSNYGDVVLQYDGTNTYGNVGIKVTPTEDLDVNGDVRVRDSLRVNATSSILQTDANGWVKSLGVGLSIDSFEIDKSVLFVSKNGNNSTAKRNNPRLPFLTIKAAVLASQKGDLIYIYPGTYNESGTTLGRDSINFYCSPGVTVSNAVITDDYGTSDMDNGGYVRWFGSGVFDNCTVSIQHMNMRYHVEGDSISLVYIPFWKQTNYNDIRLKFKFRSVRTQSSQLVWIVGKSSELTYTRMNLIFEIDRVYSTEATRNHPLIHFANGAGGGDVDAKSKLVDCNLIFDIKNIELTGGASIGSFPRLQGLIFGAGGAGGRVHFQRSNLSFNSEYIVQTGSTGSTYETPFQGLENSNTLFGIGTFKLDSSRLNFNIKSIHSDIHAFRIGEFYQGNKGMININGNFTTRELATFHVIETGSGASGDSSILIRVNGSFSSDKEVISCHSTVPTEKIVWQGNYNSFADKAVFAIKSDKFTISNAVLQNKGTTADIYAAEARTVKIAGAFSENLTVSSNVTANWLDNIGNPKFFGYGVNAKSASALSKTGTNQNAAWATDGTLYEIERKRDTTIFVTADTDYDFSAAVTTAQIASRYNRIIIHMTLTSSATADKTTTLHTPDANLMQCEILIRGTDNTGTYDNEIAFGTNNAISSDGTNTSGYTLAQGQGLHVRVVYNGSAYKYIYY